MKSHVAFFFVLAQCCLGGCGTRSVPEPVAPVSSVTTAANLQSVSADPSAPLPWSSSKYFALHQHLFRSDSKDWKPAVETLEQHGDRFTLAIIEQAQGQKNSAEKQAALDELYLRIQPKFKSLRPEEVQGLLERDAYADMMCPDIEVTLRNWTRAFLLSEAHRSEIREELERLQNSYICDEKVLELEKSFHIEPDIRAIEEQWWNDKVQFHRMNEEVKDRAERLLHQSVPSPDL